MLRRRRRRHHRPTVPSRGITVLADVPADPYLKVLHLDRPWAIAPPTDPAPMPEYHSPMLKRPRGLKRRSRDS